MILIAISNSVKSAKCYPDDNSRIYRVEKKTSPLRIITIKLRNSNEAQTYHNEICKCMTEGSNIKEIAETDNAVLDTEEASVRDIKRLSGTSGSCIAQTRMETSGTRLSHQISE